MFEGVAGAPGIKGRRGQMLRIPTWERGGSKLNGFRASVKKASGQLVGAVGGVQEVGGEISRTASSTILRKPIKGAWEAQKRLRGEGEVGALREEEQYLRAELFRGVCQRGSSSTKRMQRWHRQWARRSRGREQVRAG